MIKEKINQNKRYPKIAQRRGIEDIIKVEFMLLNNGQVKNINIINGKKIFHQATINAIKNSFPIVVPSELKKSFPQNLTLQIIYKL